jgi:hypothetical protein
VKRLYNAICSWLEADAEQKRRDEPYEPQPEGNNFAMVERAPDIRQHELNNDERPQSYGRPISLRWQPRA